MSRRPDGYEHRNRNGRKVMVHRIVMEEMLGRPLLPGETVHHKNGVRHDNRPENLELWVKTQPSGQRVEDLAEWVAEKYPTYVLSALARRLEVGEHAACSHGRTDADPAPPAGNANGFGNDRPGDRRPGQHGEAGA